MIKKALVVIDLQKGVESPDKRLYELDKVILGVNKRIHYYRERKNPIIFIQHNDSDLILNSPQWQLFSDLNAKKDDIYIDKTHANSFYNTNLSYVLNSLDIKTLEFCGAQTEFCVDTTIRFAHGMKYKCFMKRGLSTTLDSELLSAENIIKHHENIWDKRFLEFI